MAAYFLITFLALVLVPVTLTSFSRPSKYNSIVFRRLILIYFSFLPEKSSSFCPCGPCADQRKRINSLSNTSISKKYQPTQFFDILADAKSEHTF